MSAVEPRLSAAAGGTLAARYRLGPLLLAAWAAVAAAALLGGKPVLDAMSMDDSMRLVQVRDLLAGQSWFDLTQYRIDPPAGVSMHWSRLADLPLALVILAASPLAGREAAELMAVALWPALLLLPALALTAAIARELAGKLAALAAVMLVAVSIPAIVHFRPGGIDHHGLQLVLVLAAVFGAMATERHKWAAAGGGLSAAASFAIGMEMLPALAAILAALGLRWVLEGSRAARTASDFGLAFGIGAVLFLTMTVPLQSWSTTVCDTLSGPWVAAATLAGGGLALLAAIAARSAAARLSAGACFAVAAGALFVLAFPACLADPYAELDPRLATLWLAHVSEAQSVIEMARKMPEEVLPIYGPPLAALMLAVYAATRAPVTERTLHLPPLFALAALVAVALWQVRGAAAANLLASAVLAAALVRLLGSKGRRPLVRLLVALGALSSPSLAVAGQAVGWGLRLYDPARPVVFQDGPGACRRPADIAPLARLPAGLVVSFVDLGPAILAETGHTILAAPYHRNVAGNRIAFDVLLGDDAVAERALRARGVDLVAICPGGPERLNYERAAPQGLVARLSRGEVPPYLEAIAGKPDEPMRVFRVRR